VGATKKIEAMDPVRARGVSPAEGDDWLWMVDEDPAFYLEEQGGV
jgi:hypothetical protein